MLARFLSRHPRSQQGQTIVLFALMSLVLIAGLGLVIDAGVNYAQRRIMQNAADIAALTGARAIAQQQYVIPKIDRVVKDAAEANGVTRANVICEFINSSEVVIGSCQDYLVATTSLTSPPFGAIPDTITGVRIRVTETHTTLFMRAVGIRTSGTAATSMAQVQIATQFVTSDFLMAVCGIETKTTAGTKFSILTDQQVPDPYAPQPGPGSPSPSPITVVTEPNAYVKEEAYSYDWNNRDANGAFVPLASNRPEFVIQGTNAAKCRQPANWNGLLEVVGENDAINIDDDGNFFGRIAVTTQTGTLTPGSGSPPDPSKACPNDKYYGPCHTVNGPNGCTRWQNPGGGCIMIIPIADSFLSSASDSGNAYLRAWGAFQMTQVGNDYHGRLIKNYPLHTDSTRDWVRTWNGPISITLIKLD